MRLPRESRLLRILFLFITTFYKYSEAQKSMMSQKKTFIPLKQARSYLTQEGLNNNFSAGRVKKVFLSALKKYLAGEISTRFFSAIGMEISIKLQKEKPGVVKDLELLNAIDITSRLELIKSKNQNLATIEDELKKYFQKARSV